MTHDAHGDMERRFGSDDEVDQAIKRAVKETLAQHGRHGRQVVVWVDGRPVWVIPDEAPAPESVQETP